MKKILAVIGAVALLGVTFALGARFFSGEDDWLCIKGEWVKHGNPSAEKPAATLCQEEPNQKPPVDEIPTKKQVTIISPNLSLPQSSPLKLTGKMDSSWFFEANAYAKILNSAGAVIGEGPLTAQGEWMVEGDVTFKGTIDFAPDTDKGVLVIMSDNPSGLPQYQKEERFPINFLKTQKMTVKVYFPSSANDPDFMHPEMVRPVNREIIKTTAVARAALTELFKGPTATEKAAGFYTGFQTGVVINKIEIKNSVAYLDLGTTNEYNIYLPGTITTAAFIPQINQTLKQFPTIKSVIITQDGKELEIDP